MFPDLSLWVQIRTWRTIFIIGWLLSWSGKCWQLVGNRKRTALTIKSNVLLTDPFTWPIRFIDVNGFVRWTYVSPPETTLLFFLREQSRDMRTWRASVAVFPNLLTAVVKMEHMLSQCKWLDMHSIEMPLPSTHWWKGNWSAQREDFWTAY